MEGSLCPAVPCDKGQKPKCTHHCQVLLSTQLVSSTPGIGAYAFQACFGIHRSGMLEDSSLVGLLFILVGRLICFVHQLL